MRRASDEDIRRASRGDGAAADVVIRELEVLRAQVAVLHSALEQIEDGEGCHAASVEYCDKKCERIAGAALAVARAAIDGEDGER